MEPRPADAGGRATGESWLTAALPVENPRCNCELTMCGHAIVWSKDPKDSYLARAIWSKAPDSLDPDVKLLLVSGT